MDCKQKIVVVTGGSRGIGRAIVADFSRSGANVFFTYNKNDDLARSVENEYSAHAFKCSQDDIKQIEHTVDYILKENGHIDVLINNAGIKADNYLMMMSFKDWDKVLSTNLYGVYRWVKAVMRPMLSLGRGVIINIASVSGIVGVGGQTNYAASKGAILAFTKALAAELSPKGIRVNAVVPGFINTDMTAVIPRNIKKQNMDRILLKRFGTPEEVAHVVSFLASDNASYIVGQEIVVDGGLTATSV